MAQYQNGASTVNPAAFSFSQALSSTLGGALTGGPIGKLVVPSSAPKGFFAGVGQQTGRSLVRGVTDLHTRTYQVLRVSEVWTQTKIIADRAFRQVLRIPANFDVQVLQAGVIPFLGGRK